MKDWIERIWLRRVNKGSATQQYLSLMNCFQTFKIKNLTLTLFSWKISSKLLVELEIVIVFTFRTCLQKHQEYNSGQWQLFLCNSRLTTALNDLQLINYLKKKKIIWVDVGFRLHTETYGPNLFLTLILYLQINYKQINFGLNRFL